MLVCDDPAALLLRRPSVSRSRFAGCRRTPPACRSATARTRRRRRRQPPRRASPARTRPPGPASEERRPSLAVASMPRTPSYGGTTSRCRRHDRPGRCPGRRRARRSSSGLSGRGPARGRRSSSRVLHVVRSVSRTGATDSAPSEPPSLRRGRRPRDRRARDCHRASRPTRSCGWSARVCGSDLNPYRSRPAAPQPGTAGKFLGRAAHLRGGNRNPHPRRGDTSCRTTPELRARTAS